MADDKNSSLPDGWRRESVQRKSGTSAGKFDTYIFSPDNVKFRSKNEIASYIKQKKLSLNVDDFSFARSANDVSMPKVDETEKAKEKDDGAEKAQDQGEEPSAKRSRGRRSSVSEKVPTKTPSTDKKPKKAEVVQKEDDAVSATTSEKKKFALGRRGSAKVAAEPSSGEIGGLDQVSAPANKIITEETPLAKKTRGRQKKPDAVVNVDENTQDYSELVQGDVATNTQNIEDRPLVAETAPSSEVTPAFGSSSSGQLQGLPTDTTLPNIATQSTEVTQGKRIRTPKLFADEIPTPEERRLSQDEASHKLMASAKGSSSEIEGSRKKKGGRPPKKVEQSVEDPYDPFARRRDIAPFSSALVHQTPVVKPKKMDVKKRKVDFEFENDLDLIAQNSALDRDLYFDSLPPSKKERKSSGGRSSWGEIRHHDERTSPIDVQKVEREAKKEKERGKYFDTVVMTGRRERKKSGWTTGEWVDPESITSLQWSGGGGVSGSNKGYDFDDIYSPRTASGGGGGSSRGRKKVAAYGYDKAKEDSVLADLYSGVYGEPSGTMSRHSQLLHRTSASGRKSYDANDDIGGSALRMHLSQPSVPPAGPSIDEMFIAEQSMKHVHAGRQSATGGMYRKVGTSYLSKTLGERKERTVQDDLPPVICPHPSDDHTYSSLVIRQQQQLSDPMLDDEGTEDFDVGLSLLHGNGDDAKLMVAPVAASLPNGGRNHHQPQQQFVLPMRVPTVLPPQQPVEKVAVQFMTLPSVGNGGLPSSAALENGLLGRTERYRPDDVSGTTVGESLPLVLMEDDVLERSDAADSRSPPLHAATSKLTMTTTATR